MSNRVKGVIAASKGAAVSIEDIIVPNPGPGEALVRVQACGVCHTDLHYREGAITDDFPFMLGHEAAGVVESVGEGVTNVAPGDFAIIAWRAPCAMCRSCLRGRPWRCFDSMNAAQKMTLADGGELSPALGIGAFAELTLVHAGQVGQGRPRPPPPAAAGTGRMRHHGRVSARRSTPAASRAATRSPSSAAAAWETPPSPARDSPAPIPSSPWTLTTASSNGQKTSARPTPMNSTNEDAVEAIRALTGGNGVDVAIEAVGNPATYEQAFFARDLAGTVVLVGVPSPDMKIELPLLEVFGRGGSLKSSWYGDCLPTRDFPMFIDLYLQGRLDLDAFVSETIALDGVEEAFHKMERGEVLRSVVIM